MSETGESSGSDAIAKDPKSRIAWFQELFRFSHSEWKQLTNLSKFLLVSIVLIALFILFSAFYKSHQWVFSVQAHTQVAEFVTIDKHETKWRITGAVICSRHQPDEISAYSSLKPLLPESCGRRWYGFRTEDPEQTLILRGAVRTIFEAHQDGTLFLSLRPYRNRGESSQAGGKGAVAQPMTAAAILSFGNGSPDLPLGRDGKFQIKIIFPKASPTGTFIKQDRVFPFAGATTLGRDVNWTGTSMLTEGRIQIYSADKSPDKRKLVDTTTLLLGDQLRLDPVEREGTLIYPKGFVRFLPDQSSLDVIAFGSADRVRIERYGDSGYNFKPGKLSLLIHDQLFVMVISVFLTLITLITSIAAVYRKKEYR